MHYYSKDFIQVTQNTEDYRFLGLLVIRVKLLLNCSRKQKNMGLSH